MKLSQNDFEHIKDLRSRGEITLDQAHVMMVKAQRVKLVSSRLPRDVRSALNAAVKRGELGHMEKEGHKPEAYFHPTFDYLARSERNAHANHVMRAVSSVMATASQVDPLGITGGEEPTP
jgi:hypothetical protein